MVRYTRIIATINFQTLVLGGALAVLFLITIAVECISLRKLRCKTYPFCVIDTAKCSAKDMERIERINFLYKTSNNYDKYVDKANRLKDLYDRMNFLNRNLTIIDRLDASMDAFLISAMVSLAASFAGEFSFVVLLIIILLIYMCAFFILNATKKFYSPLKAAYEYEKQLLQGKIDKEHESKSKDDAVKEIFETSNPANVTQDNKSDREKKEQSITIIQKALAFLEKIPTQIPEIFAFISVVFMVAFYILVLMLLTLIDDSTNLQRVICIWSLSGTIVFDSYEVIRQKAKKTSRTLADEALPYVIYLLFAVALSCLVNNVPSDYIPEWLPDMLTAGCLLYFFARNAFQKMRKYFPKGRKPKKISESTKKSTNLKLPE